MYYSLNTIKTCVTLFCSALRLKKLISVPFNVSEFDSGCLGQNTGEAEHGAQSMNRYNKSALHRVEVNRFFLASDHSSVVTALPWRYGDDGTGASDDGPTATSYARLDVLRIALAVIDFFVIMHRCFCLGCCSCCWHSGQLITEAEVTRNGVAGSGIILCSKHDSARLQRKHKVGRTHNGSVSRPVSSFDVYDDNEDVTDGLCALRGNRHGKDASIRPSLRRRVGDGVRWRRWMQEQRRRPRQLACLLTRLGLCSIVLCLVYIVIRSLDVILAELLTVSTKQSSVGDLLVTETFLSKTFARQVRRMLYSVLILLYNRQCMG